VPLGPDIRKMAKQGQQGPAQPVASTHPSLTCPRRNLPDGGMYITRHRASTSLEARLGSMHGFVVQPTNRSKPLDLDACPMPASLHRFCRQPTNRSPLGFEVQTKKPSSPVLRPKPMRTHLSGFEAKPLTNRSSGSEAKPLTNRPSGFEAKPLTNRQYWF
jgi:hypothetical protein